tara:strand:+ start:1048 stop:1296 length:249 start_codon:yes stop_codon:yes gene_type:complete
MYQKNINILTLIFGIGLLLVSCSNSEWNAIDQKKLMKQCTDEGGSKSYCKCYLKNAMKAYPNAKDMEDLDFEASVELSLECE